MTTATVKLRRILLFNRGESVLLMVLEQLHSTLLIPCSLVQINMRGASGVLTSALLLVIALLSTLIIESGAGVPANALPSLIPLEAANERGLGFIL